MELPDKVALEAAWMEANAAVGPHSLIRQPGMRLFWWRCFGRAEEVAWDTFWSRFPKDLERSVRIHPHFLLMFYCVQPSGTHDFTLKGISVACRQPFLCGCSRLSAL